MAEEAVEAATEAEVVVTDHNLVSHRIVTTETCRGTWDQQGDMSGKIIHSTFVFISAKGTRHRPSTSHVNHVIFTVKNAPWMAYI